MFRVAKPLLVEDTNQSESKYALNDGVTISKVNAAIAERLKRNRVKRKRTKSRMKG